VVAVVVFVHALLIGAMMMLLLSLLSLLIIIIVMVIAFRWQVLTVGGSVIAHFIFKRLDAVLETDELFGQPPYLVPKNHTNSRHVSLYPLAPFERNQLLVIESTIVL